MANGASHDTRALIFRNWISCRGCSCGLYLSELINYSCIFMASTRHRVLALYKELHRLGRDYPDPK